jgi:transposase
MRKIREVMRLKYDRGLSHRQISAASGISRSTVSEYVQRAERTGLTWEVAQGLTDAEVEQRLFRYLDRHEPSIRAPVDFGWVHMELRKKGVTLQLLWTEYQEMVVDGSSGQRPYQYSQFCDLYRDYQGRLSPTMRQVHRAGEKAFIDFSGKKPRIIDPVTGEATEVELFVMVLGASSYTYAEATRTQKLEDFVGATVRGLEYFCAVPAILVPDQLKSAVQKPDWCEPEINATYAEMGQHYGTAIVPARPGKPKDKAKVEGGVLIAQRWILACLRNRRFFSLEELNEAIRELLEKLNNKPFQKLEGCRRSVFESIDRPAMRALPPRRYELGRWKLNVAVNIDYHVEYDHRYYSAPCELAQDRVDVRATAQVVELWRGGLRITSHERSYGPKGTAVTKPEHRPRSHREFGDWPPERLVGWADKTGPRTADVVEAILSHAAPLAAAGITELSPGRLEPPPAKWPPDNFRTRPTEPTALLPRAAFIQRDDYATAHGRATRRYVSRAVTQSPIDFGRRLHFLPPRITTALPRGSQDPLVHTGSGARVERAPAGGIRLAERQARDPADETGAQIRLLDDLAPSIDTKPPDLLLYRHVDHAGV